MTSHPTPSQQVAPPDAAPPFPHHAAAPQSPFEAAERQYADRPSTAPNWQPDEGDFT